VRQVEKSKNQMNLKLSVKKVISFDERSNTIQYDKDKITRMSTSDYQFLYYAFKFIMPSILSGIPSVGATHEVFCLIDEDDIKNHISIDREGFRLGPGHWGQFCQMRAKISHAYAVAELGFKSFHPYLDSYILGPLVGFFDFIGGDMTIAPKTDALHEIGIHVEKREETTLIVVTLRLFSFLGTPTYQVVVGELDNTFDQICLPTKPLYTIDIKPPFPARNLRPLSDTARGAGS